MAEILLSVVVPAHNDAGALTRSLGALAQSDLPRDCWELVVVDDASTDGTIAVAAEFADTIVRISGRPHGPSYARNRGVEAARGEIIVFIDADVSVHRDTLRRFAWAFLQAPDTAAVFGSYDDAPTAPGLISQFRNLLAHYIHQTEQGEADTFWASCGAIRRDVFISVGMYNEWHFSRPQIEGIELGHRLRDHGHRVVLRPDIQGTHHKRWTLGGMLAAELKDRGVPRGRLMFNRSSSNGRVLDHLGTKEWASTALVWLALIAVVIWGITRDSRWGWAGAALAIASVGLNLPLYWFLLRRRGPFFVLGAIPIQLLYYLVAGLSLVTATVLHYAVGDPQPSATVQAFSEVGVVKWPPVPKQMSGGRVPARTSGTMEEESPKPNNG